MSVEGTVTRDGRGQMKPWDAMTLQEQEAENERRVAIGRKPLLTHAQDPRRLGRIA
jgi:hypothetical protein